MDLTDQLWINIFKYLNENDLKNLLVIKKWRRLVIETDEFMRKLTLYLILDTWREKLEFLKVYGMFIKTVKVSHIDLLDFGELRHAFSLMRNIERVQINISKYKELDDDDGSSDGASIRFPHLRHLSIAARKKVFKKIIDLFVRCEELDSLIYDWKSFQNSPEGDDFILQQKQLTDLKLTYCHATPFEKLSLENAKFNLKKFVADFDIRKTETANFHKFLSSQISLEELILPIHWDFDYSIHELIFRKFKNLKKLAFNIFEENEEALKLNSLNLELEKVEDLSVRTDPYSHSQKSFQNVMNIFPNVKTLCVLGMDAFHFGSSKVIQNIEHLRIFRLSLYSLMLLHFPKLKILEVTYLNIQAPNEAFKMFLEKNPTIEEIVINYMNNHMSKKSAKSALSCLVENLHQLPNLKFISVKSYVCFIGNPLGRADNPQVNQQFYKFVADRKTSEKSLKVTSYFAENFPDEFEKLRHKFNDCEVKTEEMIDFDRW